MSQFKPGDIVTYLGTGNRMVVEQVYSRGRVEHVLCSYLDIAGMPPITPSSLLRKVEAPK